MQFEAEFHIAFNGEEPLKEREMTYSYGVCKDNLFLHSLQLYVINNTTIPPHVAL